MIKVIYYLVSSLLFPLVIFPCYILMLQRKIWSKERLGVFATEKISPFKNCIWLHAASVGEVNVIIPLINEYLANPQTKLVVSTMTSAGQKYLVEKCIKNGDRVCAVFLPLDFWFIWRGVFKKIKPQKIIIAETEIWPAFIFEAAHVGVPVIMVNARISDKSFRSYRTYQFLFSRLLRSMKFIYTQSELDTSRFLEIGASSENIKGIGNLKNDGLRFLPKMKLETLEFFPTHHRVVLGSLRPKELAFAIEAIQKLKTLNKEIKIIICPRHFDWLQNLTSALEQQDILYQVATKDGFAAKTPETTVLIVDQIGFLLRTYQNALLAFVGGTLFREYGGHNSLEPAALGVPVLHGPYFREQLANTNALLAKGGSKVVNTASEFVAEVEKLLLFPAEAKQISQNGIATVQLESRAMDELIKDNFFDTQN